MGEITELSNIWREFERYLTPGWGFQTGLKVAWALRLPYSLAWVGVGGFQAFCSFPSGRLAVSYWLWRLCFHGNSRGRGGGGVALHGQPSLDSVPPTLLLNLEAWPQAWGWATRVTGCLHPPSQGLPVT